LEEVTVNDIISQREADWLSELEETIQHGLKTFVDVGNALLEIRDNRLYREGYRTFEDYCRDRWGMSKQHANRIIGAYEVSENLAPIDSVLPATESQARPLTSLPPDEQREVWQRAVETAPDGKITAAHVQSVVDNLKWGDGRSATEGPANTPLIPEPTTKAHVANNSGNNEWYTPPEYIEAARLTMGAIDCDPASSEVANSIVKAGIYYTAEDDGLARIWRGRVWMNPPYAPPLIMEFCESLAAQFGDTVTEACVLVNNATETAWFNVLAEKAAAICFIKRRVKFINPQGEAAGAPLQGQVVLYLGDNINSFRDNFSPFGLVFYAR